MTMELQAQEREREGTRKRGRWRGRGRERASENISGRRESVRARESVRERDSPSSSHLAVLRLTFGKQLTERNDRLK